MSAIGICAAHFRSSHGIATCFSHPTPINSLQPKENDNGSSANPDPKSDANSNSNAEADASATSGPRQLTDLLLAVSCLAAVVSGRMGSWTALALLASTIFSEILCAAKVTFHPSLWIAIDLCVIMWIVIGWADAVFRGHYGKQRDVAILGLFLPIWALYYMTWWPHWVDAIKVLISLQMLITFPYRRAWRWGTQAVARKGGNDNNTLGLVYA